MAKLQIRVLCIAELSLAVNPFPAQRGRGAVLHTRFVNQALTI